MTGQVYLVETNKDKEDVFCEYQQYKNYEGDVEDQEIDLLLVGGEGLMVQRIMTTPKVDEIEYWRRHNIFCT